MNNVSFMGYGRFGAALGSLLREAGILVSAFDPHAEVPPELAARSLEDLVEGADLVIVAVPVTAMQAAFEALLPHLGPTQVVCDVGSVKTTPVRAMEALFGDRIPWVATHPLFGPTSLARGERPLRAVVCPNPLHPAAVGRVIALFERIGCQVMEQDPDEHDRSMAFTHALAFFVAKGLMDAGAPVDAAFAPPSFQAIARTIEAVRSDAGHLFGALHRENPHAREARKRLIDALVAADRSLEHEGMTRTEAALLFIPDLGAYSPELRETRELIDELDQEFVALLARRAQLARRASRAKADIGHGVYDPVREARLLEARRKWASDLGIDVASVDEIFQAILRFSRRVQEP